MSATTAIPATPDGDRMTMDGMPQTPAHAKPAARDHLWVLAVIAGFAMYDVWNAWTMLGDKSGFAHGTGWTLTIIADAYWGYALWAWFRAPGSRSRKFAMWTAVAIFAMSAVSQAASHLAANRVPPAAVVVFVSVLPVTVVAMIALLIHLRQLDRAEAEQAEEAARKAEQRAAAEAAAADERTALRAELEAARGAVEPLMADLETARNELGRVTAKAEVLTQKLARVSGQKRTRKSPPKKAPASTPKSGASSTPETEVPEDVDTQAAALEILAHEPGISGSELGRRLGRTERYGCMLKKSLVAAAAPADPQARSES